MSDLYHCNCSIQIPKNMHKQILLWATFVFMFIGACSKKNDVNADSAAAKMSFNANGKPISVSQDYYAYKGIIIDRQAFVPGYFIQGAWTTDDLLVGYFDAMSISVGSYPAHFQFRNLGDIYDSDSAGMINITKLENNRASGTFSGIVILHGRADSVVAITDGVFTHVKVDN
jgi:hypothetical protein